MKALEKLKQKIEHFQESQKMDKLEKFKKQLYCIFGSDYAEIFPHACFTYVDGIWYAGMGSSTLFVREFGGESFVIASDNFKKSVNFYIAVKLKNCVIQLFDEPAVGIVDFYKKAKEIVDQKDKETK